MILVVVESPAKINSLTSILGQGYKVAASYGHIRDLAEHRMSIDFDNNFEPIYVITKKNRVEDLKKAMKGVSELYIASDLDYEGSAIGQALLDILKPKKYKRLIFNSITKDAILSSIKSAGPLDERQVSAQKARRVVDRLYGFLVSPLVRDAIGGNPSAGRVQSPTTRLIVDRENEIASFIKNNSESTFYKVRGEFTIKSTTLKAVLHQAAKYAPNKDDGILKGDVAKLPVEDKTEDRVVVSFLKVCLKSEFKISGQSNRLAKRSPAPPFTTSTLQQEANRKLGMPLEVTSKVAQQLYEGGYVTYIRTDSQAISDEGQEAIREIIIAQYGEDHYQKTVYGARSASSQEAHECIRPTHPDLLSLEGVVADDQQIKLYKLIWQRAIASQMKPAKISVTTLQISISLYEQNKPKPYYWFESSIEKIVFHGFMKVYIESKDDPDEDEADIIRNFTGSLPKTGSKVLMIMINASQEFLKPPSRYTQASLVKKMEEIGIGRPSTYVDTIKRIKDKGYVEEVREIPGVKREVVNYSIKSKKGEHIMKVFEEDDEVVIGHEKNKLVPTKLGINVNAFLMKNFPDMMEYDFTARLESDLDKISTGSKIWYKVVDKFYKQLTKIISDIKSKSADQDRLLGKDEDGNKIYTTIKFGPQVVKHVGDQKFFAKIREPLTLDTITLDEALKILAYPKKLGKYEDEDILLKISEHGPYVYYQKENFGLPRGTKAEDVDLKMAINAIKTKKSQVHAEFEIKYKGKTVKAVVKSGEFGDYIQIPMGKKHKNFKIRDIKIQDLTVDKVEEIVNKPPRKRFTKKAAAGGSKRTVKRSAKGVKRRATKK